MDGPAAVVFSVETAIIFCAVLLIAFCCGFVRSIRQHFVVKRQAIANLHRLQRRNIVVTHIRLPGTSMSNSSDNDIHVTLPGIYPSEAQIQPPPYSEVSNEPPPTYDDAIKRTSNANINNITEESKI